MTTVLLYLFILIGSTFFIYISERGKGKLEHVVFTTIAFLIIFLPSAIRYDVGRDYFSYISIFNNIESKTRIEPAFYYLNLFLKDLNIDPQSIFICSSFIFTYFLFKSLPKKGGWLVSFLILASLYLFSLSGIRQSLGIMINLFSLHYLIKGKIKPFVIFSILASLFHASTLIFMLIGLSSLIPINRYLKYYLIPNIFMIILVVLFISSNFIFPYIIQILNLVGLERYIGYFSGRFFRETQVGSGLGVLGRILFCVYFIYNSKNVLSYNKNYWPIILLVFVFAISTILSSKIHIFLRVSVGFSIILPIAAYILLTLNKNKQLNRLIVILLTMLLTHSYIQSSKSIDAKLNPYKTIFNQSY